MPCSASKCERISSTGPILLPILLIQISILFAPRFWMHVFVSRLICSMYKSQEMLHPILPLVLINLEHSYCIFCLSGKNH